MICTRLRRYNVVLALILVMSLGSVVPQRALTGMAFRLSEAHAIPGPNADLKDIIDFIMRTLHENGDLLKLNEIIDDIVVGVSNGDSSTCPAVTLDPPLTSLANVPQRITLIADYNGPDGTGCATASGTTRRGRLTVQATDIRLTGLALSANLSLQADHLVQIDASGEVDEPILNGFASGDLALNVDFLGKANAILNLVSTRLMVGATPISGGITAGVSGLDIINGAPSDVTVKLTFDDFMQGAALTAGGVTVVAPSLALNGTAVDPLILQVTFDNFIVDGSTLSRGLTAVISNLTSDASAETPITLDVVFDEAGLVFDEWTFLGGFDAEIAGLGHQAMPGDMTTIHMALKPLAVVSPRGTTTYAGGGAIVQTVVDSMTMQTAVDVNVANFGPIVLTLQSTTDAMGQTFVSTIGAGSVGTYQVQIIDAIRFNPTTCENLPIGGKIRLEANAQISTVEFFPACNGSYLFNGQLANTPTTL